MASDQEKAGSSGGAGAPPDTSRGVVAGFVVRGLDGPQYSLVVTRLLKLEEQRLWEAFTGTDLAAVSGAFAGCLARAFGERREALDVEAGLLGCCLELRVTRRGQPIPWSWSDWIYTVLAAAKLSLPKGPAAWIVTAKRAAGLEECAP